MATPRSAFSPKLENYFADYASYHHTKGNRVTHSIGIPMIVVGLLGLLGSLPIGPLSMTGSSYFRLDGGSLLLLCACFWYLYLDWKLTLPFSLILAGFYFLGRTLPTSINGLLFILGWILQAIGHAVYEKKSPAFFKNGTHLLIGPIWIFARLFK